ncbi:MAG TPA: iron ABC transporter permease [Anaerolineales bacterium]|nr:iron ABC transporter permease [Anaerolineales bacterium]
MSSHLRTVRQWLGDWTLSGGLVLAVIFLALGIVWPLLRMLALSLSPEGLAEFAVVLGRGTFQRIAINTLVMGAAVATLGTGLAFLFAFVQVWVNVPFKRLLHWIALLPIISPPFAVALAVISLFGRSGLITYRLFGLRYDIYGLDGLTLVLSLSFFPAAYIGLLGMMRALNPALDEAAINLGASRWHVFRTVTVPILVPGILGSFLLLFVEAMADLGNPLALGGDFTVLASRIYIAIIGEYDMIAGAVLSVNLLVPTLALFLAQNYIVNRKSYVTVTGKPAGTPRLISSPFARWSLFAAVASVAALIVLIYGTVLVGAFTRLFGIDYSFTLDNFKFVLFGYGSQAMVTTVILAGIAMPIAALIGTLVAYLVTRKQFPGRNALDFASMLGLAVPGTVLGIGYVLAYNQPIEVAGITLLPKLAGGAGLLGGAAVIVLSFAARSMPASVRNGTATLQQIDPVLEEASLNLGADNGTTFRRITLPLIRPAVLSGMIYAFARSMTSLSSIIFLTTPYTKIMVAQIFTEADAGRFGNAFAYCVILIAIVLVAIALLYRVIGSTTGAEREASLGG